MGKYMRKAKITGEVAVMEVSHQSSLGVRTRAKTLALQRLQPSPAAPAPVAAAADTDSSGSYLQLRSRRLEKPVASAPTTAKLKEIPKRNPNPSPAPEATKSPKPRLMACSVDSGSVKSASAKSWSKKSGRKKVDAASEAYPDNEGGLEVSFGENILEVESRDRNVRETTPCSMIRDSETVGTPGSTTRSTNSTTSNRRIQNSTIRDIPTTNEMEEFFAGAEQLQQRAFTKKYNFDPVNDCPLPGRYAWVRLDC